MKGLIFTYALTLFGSVAGLVSPFHGLLCYVCFAIVKPEHMWPWSVPEGRYSLLLALTNFRKLGALSIGRSSSLQLA